MAGLDSGEMRDIRRTVQIVFQDPYASLNPRMTVSEIIAEPLRASIAGARVGARTGRGAAALVGPATRSTRTAIPHEFSGGQRQRIGIARALALEPEAARARRAGVRARRVDPGGRHQPARGAPGASSGLAYVFIAHDLSVVRHISDRVAVMYLGQDRRDRLSRRRSTDARPSLHPGAAVGRPASRTRGASGSAGASCSRATCRARSNPPSGCRFRTRCWKAQSICAEEEPALVDRGQGHPVACHFAEAIEVV